MRAESSKGKLKTRVPAENHGSLLHYNFSFKRQNLKINQFSIKHLKKFFVFNKFAKTNSNTMFINYKKITTYYDPILFPYMNFFKLDCYKYIPQQISVSDELLVLY